MGQLFTRSKVSSINRLFMSAEIICILLFLLWVSSYPNHRDFIYSLPLFTEGSPLLHLVDPGDIILTIDGVDCRSKDALALAHWISTKPAKNEQVITLKSVLNDDDHGSI